MNVRKLIPMAAAAAIAALLPLFARSASAALITAVGRPITPAIAYDARFGTYLVVWSEDRGGGTGNDLYAARLNRNGIVNGVEVPVVVAPGNQGDPALAYSERVGQFLLVFTDDGAGNLPVPGGGNPTATPVGPPLPPPPVPFQPPSGGLPDAVGALVPAGVLADLGAAEGQPTPPLPPPPGQPTATSQPPPPPGQPTATTAPGQPTAVPPPGPGQPPPAAPGSRDIYGTWLATNGRRVSQTFALVTSPADDTYPDLATLSSRFSERIALVWREVTGIDVQVAVQSFVGGFGQYLIVDGPKAIVASGGDKGRPSVAVEQNTGEWLVAWAETPAGQPSRDVFGRRLNSNAFPYRPVLRLATGAADQVYPSVGSLGAFGGYVLAFEHRAAGQSPEVHVRQLNRNGIPLRAEYDLAGGGPFSFGPDISSSAANSTLVVWIDRNAAGDHSVLAAEVNRSGRRVGPERVIVQGGAGPGAVTPVPPPPMPPVPPPPVP